MENRFYIQYARFHTAEKNTFLICGHWHEGSKKNRELLVSLDYTALKVTVQKQKTIKTPKAYIEQGECDEKVFRVKGNFLYGYRHSKETGKSCGNEY